MSAPRTLLVVLLGLSVLVGGFCATASAEDAPVRERVSDASAVSKLTAGERKLLEQRIKNWAELPAAKQERIARRVLQLRNMTAEERARLRDRIAHKVRHPEMGAKGTPRGRRHEMRHMWAVAKGLGSLMAKGRVTKDVQRALHAKGIRGGHLEAALLRRFFARIQKQRMADVETIEASTLDPRLREQFLRAKGALESPSERQREKAKKEMAQLAVVNDVKQLLDGSPRPKPPFDKQTAPPTREQREAWQKQMVAHYQGIGEQVRAKWPEAYKQTQAELGKVAKDADKLVEWVQKHGHAARQGDPALQALRGLAFLNSYVAKRPGNKALRTQFDALLRTALEDQQVPPKMIKRLLETKPQDRGQMLLQMMKQRGGAAWQRRDGRRRSGGMRQPGVRRQPGGGPPGPPDDKDK